jgi:hypothetical protein
MEPRADAEPEVGRHGIERSAGGLRGDRFHLLMIESDFFILYGKKNVM